MSSPCHRFEIRLEFHPHIKCWLRFYSGAHATNKNIAAISVQQQQVQIYQTTRVQVNGITFCSSVVTNGKCGATSDRRPLNHNNVARMARYLPCNTEMRLLTFEKIELYWKFTVKCASNLVHFGFMIDWKLKSNKKGESSENGRFSGNWYVPRWLKRTANMVWNISLY